MRSPWFLVILPLLLVPAWTGCAPARPATPPARLELTAASWEPGGSILQVETEVPEEDPYGTHGRIELSLLDPLGRELLRGAYCACSRVDPVPPGAFGLYRIGSDGRCSPQEVVSAGIGADRPATAGGFTLLPATGASRHAKLLHLVWVLRADEPLPPGRYPIRGRVVPLRGSPPPWQRLARLDILDASHGEVVVPPARTAGGAPPLPEALRRLTAGDDPAAGLRAAAELLSRGIAPEDVVRVRTVLLRRLIHHGSFAAGSERYDVADIQRVYEHFLLEPDALRLRVVIPGDLPALRFLYLVVVEGVDHDAPAPANATWALPKLDASRALSSPDPWIVSAALFLARANGTFLDPADLAARRRRPGWDPECSRQAILYLARLAPAELGHRGAALLAELTGGAAPVPETICLVQPVPFHLSAGEPEDRPWADPRRLPLKLVFRDDTMEEIGRRPLSLPAGGVTKLSPSSNFLSLTLTEERVTGRSRHIQPKGGRLIRLPVELRGGV